MEISTENTKTLVAETIKEFVAKHNFTSVVPVVRTNTNGYPFVTFITEDNKAENVYFSKSASEQVDNGTPVNKDMLAKYQIGYTTNEAGEKRIKLISNSERVGLADMF